MKYEKKDEIATVNKMSPGMRAKDLAVKEWNPFVALNMKIVNSMEASFWALCTGLVLTQLHEYDFCKLGLSWDLATLHLKHLLELSISMYLCSCPEKQMVKDFLSEASKWSNDPLLYKDETGLAKLANMVCG